MIQGQVQHGDDEHAGEGHYGVDDWAGFQHRPEVGPFAIPPELPESVAAEGHDADGAVTVRSRAVTRCCTPLAPWMRRLLPRMKGHV